MLPEARHRLDHQRRDLRGERLIALDHELIVHREHQLSAGAVGARARSTRSIAIFSTSLAVP